MNIAKAIDNFQFFIEYWMCFKKINDKNILKILFIFEITKAYFKLKEIQ